MAEERIDIVVTDKVDASIPKKFNQIADGAERAESYIKRLKAAVASVNASALDRLASAMAKADNAQAKLLNSQANLTRAQMQGSGAADRAALAQQKLATEAAKTTAAQARAATATAQAALASQRLAAAQGATTGASNAAANAAQHNAAASGQSAAQMNAAAGAARNLGGAATQAATGMNTLAGANQRAASGFGNTVNAANQYARAARTANAANANIIAQMQDIGVSLAGGQNPLLVLIQQGSQLSYIASTLQGGWTQLMATVGRMVLGFAPLIAILGLLAIAFQTLRTESEKAANLDEFVNTLGLTRQEIKRLDDVTITWGDTWNATMRVLAEGMGTTTEEISSFWDSMWARIGRITRAFIGVALGLFVGLAAGVASAIVNLGKAIVAFFVGTANIAMKAFEKMVNFTIGGINMVSGAINELFGTQLGRLEDFKAPQIELDFDFTNPLKDAAIEAEKFSTFIQGEFAKIGKYQEEEAKKRLRNQANEIIKDRPDKKGPKGREDHTAERRAHAIAMVNLKLDDEIARMKLLKDERAIQQRMDQIEESLAQKKIKLNDQERATIEGKVRAIEQFKYVQSQMDQIYEEATGPLRDYNAALEAADLLFSRGQISAERHALAIGKAKMAYQEAVDPLNQFKLTLEAQERTLGKYGVELERANYLEQIRQELVARGYEGDRLAAELASSRVQNLIAENDQMRQKLFIQSQLAAVVNPIMDQTRELESKQFVYDELERMRQADLIREEDYQRAKAALWLKYNEQKANITAEFFGTIASITKRGHGIVGKISKAAAIAEAVIQGYVAVQRALATVPYPFNYVAAATVAMKTAAQVAGIISTPVGNYKDGGQFIVQGRDGVDANNINMNVTKGERVTIETKAQQRANDNAPGASPVLNAPVKVVNLYSMDEFIRELDGSDEGERVVMNIVRRNESGGGLSG